MIRGVLVRLFRRIVGVYFRSIEEAGNRPDENTCGRLFVSNHVNGLVDPILVLTRAPCRISPVAKSTLWKIPGLRWLLDVADAVPILRRRDDPNKNASSNEAIFDRIADWLKGGGNILIFPEGTSHNEPHLSTVKTGAARMVVRAYERGATDATFQAVALEFDARHLFRSRALILYGPTRRVADFTETGEELVRAITERTREDLSEFLVEGETWSDRLLIARVAEMLANDTGDRTMARWNTIGRQVEAARRTLGNDDDNLRGAREAVTRYYELLGQEGLSDHQLADDDESGPRVRYGEAVWLILMSPLALLGAAVYFLPYQMPRLVARKARDDPDKMSTLKLGTGLLVYPLWSALLIAASLFWLSTVGAVVSTVLLLVSPFAALAWLDVGPSIKRTFRLQTRGKRLVQVGLARQRAVDQIQKARAQLNL